MRLLYFAWVRERLGKAEEQIDPPVGVATVAGANNGVMTLYKAEAAKITVTDGALNNGAGLAVTVSAA